MTDEYDADEYGVCEECGDVLPHDDLLQVTVASPGMVWGGALCRPCFRPLDEQPGVSVRS